MSLRKHFQTSLDLPGVAGAFCLSSKGDLVESFMPAPYTDDVFDELGPRLANLTDAVDMSYSQTNELLLQFESNALYLRRSENVLIGFFTAHDPLLAGLRVSANLLLKQAKSELDNAVMELASAQKPSGQAAHSQAAEEEDDDDDDAVILQNNSSKKETDSKPETKRKGLFGRKKSKPSKSNDIWG